MTHVAWKDPLSCWCLQPLVCISVVTEDNKATPSHGSATPVTIHSSVNKTAEEALVSKLLRAQTVASGCSDLQQYVRHLQLLASSTPPGTPSPALTSLKLPRHAGPFQTVPSQTHQPPSFQVQTEFCPPTVASSPVQNAKPLWSAPQPGKFCPQAYAQASVLPGMHPDYYSTSVQSASVQSTPAETLSLVSGSPTFPAWSESSASSESACSSSLPYSEPISHHFPASGYAELELQLRLAQLCQSANDAAQQRQGDPYGHYLPGIPLFMCLSEQQAIVVLRSILTADILNCIVVCQCLLLKCPVGICLSVVHRLRQVRMFAARPGDKCMQCAYTSDCNAGLGYEHHGVASGWGMR